MQKPPKLLINSKKEPDNKKWNIKSEDLPPSTEPDSLKWKPETGNLIPSYIISIIYTIIRFPSIFFSDFYAIIQEIKIIYLFNYFIYNRAMMKIFADT